MNGTRFDGSDPELGPEQDDDETPRKDQPIRCLDGMCGAEDCERCNP